MQVCGERAHAYCAQETAAARVSEAAGHYILAVFVAGAVNSKNNKDYYLHYVRELTFT